MSKRLLMFTLICCYCISNATSAQEKQCFSCNGISCLRTTMENNIETCENNLDSCVTIFDKFAVVVKGCYMNIPVELRRKCDDVKNPECQMCAGGLCNNMGRSDFKCYECDERSTKCATNIKEFTPIQCRIPTSLNSYCYVKSYKGYTIRGCSLSVKDQLACLSDAACTLCLAEDGEGCNSKEMEPASGSSKLSGVFALILITSSIIQVIFRF